MVVSTWRSTDFSAGLISSSRLVVHAMYVSMPSSHRFLLEWFCVCLVIHCQRGNLLRQMYIHAAQCYL